MAGTTVYDIKLRYMVKDEVSKAMKKMRSHVKSTDKSAQALSKSFRMATTAAAGFFSVRFAKKMFIDLNSGLEQAKIKMAGLLQLNTGGTFNDNMAKSNVLVDRFAVLAAKGAGATGDYVEMASMIAGPVTAAGLSMKQLEKVTAGAVVASKAFGVDASFAARDIEQALSGMLGAKDRFARSLLGPAGFKDMEEFNQLSAKDRAAALMKAFDQPALKDMGKAQAKSWAGVTDKLEDGIKTALAKIGLPLMKALSKEFSKISDWMDKNPKKIAEIGKSISDGLITAFNVVKDALSLLYRNRETLLMLAKAFIGFKAVKAAGGMLGGIAASLGGLGKDADKAGSALGKLGRATGILGATTALAFGMKDYFDRKTAQLETKLQREERIAGMREAAQQVEGRWGTDKERRAVKQFSDVGSVEEVKRKRLLNIARGRAGGDFTRGLDYPQMVKLAEGNKLILTQLMLANAEYVKRQWGLAETHIKAGNSMSTVAATLGGVVKETYDLSMQVKGFAVDWAATWGASALKKAQGGDVFGAAAALFGHGETPSPGGGSAGRTNVNVTIHRIEAKSDDPERIVFGLHEAFMDIAKNPSQAANALYEG